MKLTRLEHSPSALLDFFEEGLNATGAICERTWHDKLQVVAEGKPAQLWDPAGGLIEREIRFVPANDTAPRHADDEVFPGCPLTFKLAEELRPKPLPLERAALHLPDGGKAPTLEAAERLWHAEFPGSGRWRLLGNLTASWHFSLLVLARCEIQAIDQHWALHRLAISLVNHLRDETLPASLDFVELTPAPAKLDWPRPDLNLWRVWLNEAFALELEPDLLAIRARQQQYLRRELERIDQYFDSYEKELTARARRSHADSAKIKVQDRLAAAQAEHTRRRLDQVRRHEVHVVPHLDALVMIAEPAWQGNVSFILKGENKTTAALYLPRCRRWVVPA